MFSGKLKHNNKFVTLNITYSFYITNVYGLITLLSLLQIVTNLYISVNMSIYLTHIQLVTVYLFILLR